MASQIWSGNGMPPAYALVKINPDGTATVITGTQDIGTGTRTVLAQIAAEELGFALEKISVELGDTQTGPYAPLSAGSMTVASVGPAVRLAAHEARQQLLDVAPKCSKCRASRSPLPMGSCTAQHSQSPWLCMRCSKISKTFMIIGRGARAPNPEDVTVNTFGAQFAEVLVDTETGEVKVERIVAVHDSGRVINPLTLSSQIEGGIIQGLGYALFEQRVLDRDTGIVVNDNLENYKVPTALDVPEIVFEMIDRPDPRANNLRGQGRGRAADHPHGGSDRQRCGQCLGREDLRAAHHAGESSQSVEKLMKIREVIRLIEADGWYQVACEGSYRQFKHPTKKGRVTIAGNLGDDIDKGTLNSILKQASLKHKRRKGL
jgi:CO/xanthine dehydrogenase Mo-binding subunit/predicted RNA binding protein YcfA (HicA-like mRNA interferase family)